MKAIFKDSKLSKVQDVTSFRELTEEELGFDVMADPVVKSVGEDDDDLSEFSEEDSIIYQDITIS